MCTSRLDLRLFGLDLVLSGRLTIGSSFQPNKSAASGTSQPQRGRLMSVFKVAQGQMWNKNIIRQRYPLKSSLCWLS